MRLFGSRHGLGVFAVLVPAMVLAACSDDDDAVDGGGATSGAAGEDGNGGSGAGKGGSSAGKGGDGKGGSQGGSVAQGGDKATAGEGGAVSGAAGEPGQAGVAGEGGDGPGEVIGDTYVLTSENRLLFVARASGVIASSVDLSGLGANETAVGMDFRPSDGALYVLTDAGKLYTLNLSSGAATLKTTLKADPADTTDAFVALAGTRFGIDFNPVANRLRVVSDTGQNLRINVDVVDNTTTDTALNPGTPSVSAAAYTNNFAAACRTRLYVLDQGSGKLLIQDPPNDGKLVEVGATGAAQATFHGFEIVTSEDGAHNLVNTALAVASKADDDLLYDLNLTTGAVSNARVVALGAGESIVGLGVAPPAGPLTQAMGELAGVTVSSKLVSFNRGAPGKLCSSQSIAGLAGGEEMLGIDVRPADGKLYALSSTGKLYTLAAALGVPVTAASVTAAAVSTLAADAADSTNPFTALTGSNFGIDFNPVPDRLRVLSDVGQSLRINLDAAAGVSTDSALSGVASGATAAAYTNSFAGARSTTLFVLDASSDTLARVGSDPATGGACPGDQGNPNCGVVTAVGALGVGDISAVSGFDIDGKTGVAGSALAAVTIGAATTSTLISINLETGAAGNPPGVANATIGGGEALRGLAFVASPTVTVRALTASDHLVSFNPRTPNTVSDVTITGLQPSETLKGIDVRPLDGKLYALGSAGRLYSLDTASGAATLVAVLSAAATDDAPFSTLSAGNHGVDFNPTVDLLRVVDGTSANLRLVPSARTLGVTAQLAGAVFTDALLSAAAVAAAYTNNFVGASTTTLFDIDSGSDSLLRQGNPNPNDGVLTTIGPLGVDASGDVGFDIAGGRNGLALAAILPTTEPVSTSSSLYVVNLGTGAASLYPVATGSAVIGNGGTTQVRGLAIEIK
jgi:trimeric autotransporter adhesin